ncbi:MAG: hypothetical protein WAT39_23305 [Planctomycetota bacterium]
MRTPALVLACLLGPGCAVQVGPPLTPPPGAQTVWIESLGLE